MNGIHPCHGQKRLRMKRVLPCPALVLSLFGLVLLLQQPQPGSSFVLSPTTCTSTSTTTSSSTSSSTTTFTRSKIIDKKKKKNHVHLASTFAAAARRTTLASATVNRADAEASSSSSASSSSFPPESIQRHRHFAPRQQQQQQQQHVNKKQRQVDRKIRLKFQRAKALERQGQWRKAAALFHDIITVDDARDAYSHLALAKLQARRKNVTAAHSCFARGTEACPDSVHLWQAWAVHEESLGHVDQARTLYERALQIDRQNPYVCHAYGLMEYRANAKQAAQQLWQQALERSSSAALVCSLGHLWIEQGKYDQARKLYQQHVDRLQSKREKTEVYLAAAWLEERHYNFANNFERAEQLIHRALEYDPQSSLAQVALARLQGRSRQRYQGEQVHAATSRRLANVCIGLEQGNVTSQPQDGRVYNAWANMEVKARRYDSARNILRRAVARYPRDHSLLQAAGKVEERVGNYTGARDLYSASLCVQPSAPTLVAYALLELKRPLSGKQDFSMVEKLFEEALLLDPRHGPAYNSYGNAHLAQGNVTKARGIFQRGVRANCTDVASVYHGYARLELSLGNVKRAKLLLKKGLAESRRLEMGTDSPHRERASFLTHTLGMLELNSAKPAQGLTIFADGIHRYGNSSKLLLGAALCEAKLGNEAKARSLFERSVVADERHAQAWQAWGIMEMRAGNWNSSRTLFQCGIKSASRHGALWLAYATLEGRLGNTETARTLFAHGVKRAPNHVPLYRAWASLELKMENFTDAKALITEALTRDKRYGSGWIVAAEIERRLGNSGLVNLILRRGIECCPAYVELYRALGDSLISSGKIKEARQVFEKGIEIDPLHAPLYHSLAELEARVFNLDGLAKLNRKAAAIFNTNATAGSQNIGEETWGSKIKAERSPSVPRGVVALAQRIVDDENEWGPKTIDPSKLVDSLNTNFLEGGYIMQLLGEDEGSIESDDS